MLDEATLAANLLTFRSKSFGFSHRVAGTEGGWLVFHRTETESETRLRPKLVQLYLVVPEGQIGFDEPSESLVLGEGTPAAGAGALEASADPEEFDEQGRHWKRKALSGDRILYVPAADAAELFGSDWLPRLGLTGTPGRA